MDIPIVHVSIDGLEASIADDIDPTKVDCRPGIYLLPQVTFRLSASSYLTSTTQQSQSAGKWEFWKLELQVLRNDQPLHAFQLPGYLDVRKLPAFAVSHELLNSSDGISSAVSQQATQAASLVIEEDENETVGLCVRMGTYFEADTRVPLAEAADFVERREESQEG